MIIVDTFDPDNPPPPVDYTALPLVWLLSAAEQDQDPQALAEIRRRIEAVPATKIVEALVEAKFDPDQPRIPAGQPGGGRWLSVLGDLAAALAPRHEQYRRGLKNPERANADLLDDPTRMKNLPEDVQKALRQHVEEVFGVTPEEMVANLDRVFSEADADVRERGTTWYPRGHEHCVATAERHGYRTDQVVGAVAAMSPQTEWGANIALADYMAKAIKEDRKVDLSTLTETRTKDVGDQKVTLTLLEWAQVEVEKKGGAWPEHLDGTRLSDHDPLVTAALVKAMGQRDGLSYTFDTEEGRKDRLVSYSSGLDGMAKAVRILRGEQPGDVLSGHKVRSFFNNLLVPNDQFGDVTIDTHAVSAAVGRKTPASSPEMARGFQSPSRVKLGLVGTYPVFADAYRAIAEKYGLTPAEVQAIIWIQWRKDHKEPGWMI